MITIENLTKYYGKKRVLNRINLQFEAGRVYGIVGENGAGKTTLFRCVTSLETFDGSLHADRRPIKDHIGFLPAEPYFLSHMTGREYLRLLCEARDVQPGDLDQRNVFDLPLDEYAAHYSTGMKKKLAILGLLFQGNPYVILDEPFNGLDIQSGFIVAEIIKRLRDLGKTVLVSSHIFSTLSDACDVIFLLKNGEVVRSVDKKQFDALHEEMMTFSLGDKVERLGLF